MSVAARVRHYNLRKMTHLKDDINMCRQMPFDPRSTVYNRWAGANYLHDSWLDYLYWDIRLEYIRAGSRLFCALPDRKTGYPHARALAALDPSRGAVHRPLPGGEGVDRNARQTGAPHPEPVEGGDCSHPGEDALRAPQDEERGAA